MLQQVFRDFPAIVTIKTLELLTFFSVRLAKPLRAMFFTVATLFFLRVAFLYKRITCGKSECWQRFFVAGIACDAVGAWVSGASCIAHVARSAVRSTVGAGGVSVGSVGVSVGIVSCIDGISCIVRLVCTRAIAACIGVRK